MNWLLNRWEIKLAALVLAVSLYVFTGTLVTEQKTLAIQIANEDIEVPDRFVITDVGERDFYVQVTGPRSYIRELTADVYRPRLRIEEGQQGEHTIPITAKELDLNPELTVMDGGNRGTIVYASITLSQLEAATLPVVDRPPLDLPEGLVAREVRLSRTDARVLGPRELVTAAQDGNVRIQLSALQLPGLDPTLTEPIVRTAPVVMTPPAGLQLAGSQELEVTVVIAPKAEQRTVSVPLHLLAAPHLQKRFDVVLKSDRVPLKLIGPQNKLSTLSVERDLRAFVDLSIEPGLGVEEERPVQVSAPDWLTVDSSPVKVRLQERTNPQRQNTPPVLPSPQDLPADPEAMPQE